MRAKRLVGPEASSQKYDILTALGGYGLAAPSGTQRLVLRFVTLITARYNWREGSLSVGQREIARLWSVDERTVKREMAKLRALGWLTVETSARRGRVATYALDLDAIRASTRGAWSRVGGDFEARMGALVPEPRDDTVIPFPARDAARVAEEPATPEGAEAWTRIRHRLRAEDPAIFANWFEALRCEGGAGEGLTLIAPSDFHASYIRTHFAERLIRAARAAEGRIVGIRGAPEADDA